MPARAKRSARYAASKAAACLHRRSNLSISRACLHSDYYASVLIDAGVPITAVAAYLGHASAEFTLRVYGHRMEAADSRALAALTMAERYATGTQATPDNVVDLRKPA